jgi:hypothetical protein
MVMRKMVLGAVLAVACVTMSAPVYAWHWTPPTSTNYWETVWGYITGFTPLAPGNEVAAFRTDNNAIVGMTTVSWDGSQFGYNMVMFAPSDSFFDVYFLVWDGTQELLANPQFTTHPGEFGAGPTQHDLHAVPEPSTMALAAVAGLSLFGAMRKRLAARFQSGR